MAVLEVTNRLLIGLEDHSTGGDSKVSQTHGWKDTGSSEVATDNTLDTHDRPAKWLSSCLCCELWSRKPCIAVGSCH